MTTPDELEQAVERAMKKRDHPSSDTLGFTTLATADFDTIMKALSERAELLAAVERMRGEMAGMEPRLRRWEPRVLLDLCVARGRPFGAALNTGEEK